MPPRSSLALRVRIVLAGYSDTNPRRQRRSALEQQPDAPQIPRWRFGLVSDCCRAEVALGEESRKAPRASEKAGRGGIRALLAVSSSYGPGPPAGSKEAVLCAIVREGANARS
jgi:hypothetical protein